MSEHHIRHQIREAARADLTGLPTTGPRVWTARVRRLVPAEMPGLIIRILDEDAAWDAMGAIARNGRLLVEGYAPGNDGLEDVLDTIGLEVETAIYAAPPALGPLLMNIDPPATQIRIEEPEAGADGRAMARRTGTIRMLFGVTYRTPEGDPSTQI